MSSDLDEYRQPWESDEHWAIRREFLERYQDEFDEDRLLCLAQVYANMELLNCSYPEQVETQVRELALNLALSRELKSGGKDKNAIHFVRGESDTHMGNKKSPHLKQMFVRSCETHGTNNSTPRTADQAKPMENQQSCIGGHSGITDSQKDAQKHHNMSNNLLPETNNESGKSNKMSLSESNINQQSIIKAKLERKFKKMSRFIRGAFMTARNSINVLNDTCKKFDMKIDYQFRSFSSRAGERHCCKIFINDVFISENVARNAEEAREIAARLAFDIFIKRDVILVRNDVGELCLKPSDASNLMSESKKDLKADLKLQKKFKRLSKLIREAFGGTNKHIKALTAACEKVKVPIEREFSVLPAGQSGTSDMMHSCTLKINKVFVCKSAGSTKEESEFNAVREAFTLLSKPGVFVAANDKGVLCLNYDDVSESFSEDSDEPVPTKKQKGMEESETASNILSTEPNVDDNVVYLINSDKLFAQSSDPMFLLLDNSAVSKNDNPGQIILQSASFCHTPINFEFKSVSLDGCSGFSCKIFLNNKLACDAIAKTKQEAKRISSDALLKQLKRNHYTIKVNDSVGGTTGSLAVTREHLMKGRVDGLSLSDTNIGHKMLKMMGWSGGSIGKDGQSGIIEPVKADTFHERGKGLGFSNNRTINQDFMSHVDSVLKDYIASNSTSDLVFSTEFSKEERKKIHVKAQKYNLKSVSRGSDFARQLVISRKFTAPELFKLLKNSGGMNAKYELIHPSKDSNQ